MNQGFLAWAEGSVPDVPAHVSCTYPWAREGAAAANLLAPFGIEAGKQFMMMPGCDRCIESVTDIVGDLLVLATADIDDHFAAKADALRRRAEAWVQQVDSLFRPHVARKIRAGVFDRLGVVAADPAATIWRLLRKRTEEIMNYTTPTPTDAMIDTTDEIGWFGARASSIYHDMFC